MSDNCTVGVKIYRVIIDEVNLKTLKRVYKQLSLHEKLSQQDKIL